MRAEEGTDIERMCKRLVTIDTVVMCNRDQIDGIEWNIQNI